MSYSDCYSAGVAQAELARAELAQGELAQAELAGGGDGASHSTVQAETQLAQAERELAEIARAEQAPLFMSTQPYQPWHIRHERGAELAMQVRCNSAPRSYPYPTPNPYPTPTPTPTPTPNPTWGDAGTAGEEGARPGAAGCSAAGLQGCSAACRAEPPYR